ncbi:MAG TPA: YceI family protein [Gemmatimonadaceae bacterium]|nr:YceI family protein [Gemmatimonadaceae bacterium]
MRTPKFARLMALALTAPALLAMTSSAAFMKLQPGSRLWVNGSSTVRSFECSATMIDAKVETSGPGTAVAVANGAKAVSAVKVAIPAAKLDCKNGTMNGHMMKALKASEAPIIAFDLAGYDLAKSAAGTAVTLKGTLSIGGQTKPVTIAALAKSEGTALRVTGTHEVRMTEFGLKPPTLMMGTMKVNELVKVSFDLQLTD